MDCMQNFRLMSLVENCVLVLGLQMIWLNASTNKRRIVGKNLWSNQLFYSKKLVVQCGLVHITICGLVHIDFWFNCCATSMLNFHLQGGWWEEVHWARNNFQHFTPFQSHSLHNAHASHATKLKWNELERKRIVKDIWCKV